eukprot:5490370-Prymnesium_polylepis.1
MACPMRRKPPFTPWLVACDENHHSHRGLSEMRRNPPCVSHRGLPEMRLRAADSNRPGARMPS